MPRYTLVMFQSPDILTPAISDAIFSAMMGNSPKDALDFGLYHVRRTVEASDLEDLFTRCQHLYPDPDHPMTGLRSLSVGDFAIDEDGKIHHCKTVGWDEAEEEVADSLRALLLRGTKQVK